MSTEEFLFKIAADTKELREELKKARAETGKFSKQVDEANNKGVGLNLSLGKVAGVVGVVATAVTAAAAAFTAYTTAQGRAIRETEIMAQMAGLTVEEFRRMSFVLGTVGIDADSVGSIFADAQEKIGDFLNTGGGGFQDFVDAMGYTKAEATALASEFERMSGQQVLQEMVNRMEAAGVSTQRMNHALEGMSGEARRLIPLLKDNGAQAKALGETFDSVNVPLSDEERAQFKALADNVDLAQASFVNFLNNAIAPFLPAINAAATALAEFFAVASARVDLDRIVEDNTLVEQIDSLGEVDRLQEILSKKIADREAALENNKIGHKARVDEEALKSYQAAAAALEAQRKAIEEKNKAEQEALDLEAKKGNLKTSVGADDINAKQKLLDELAAKEAAQKSSLQLLEEERRQRYSILQSMYSDEAKLTDEELSKKADLAARIEKDYLQQVNALSQTQADRRVESMAKELGDLRALLDEKIVSQEQYQARVAEILGTSSDGDASELDKLQTERAERLAVLEKAFQDEAALTADQLREKNELASEIEANYLSQAAELAKTEDQKKVEQAERELSLLQQLQDEKLISQEEFEAKRREIIENYDPASLDPEMLEEKNQEELEALQKKLADQLISYEGYYEQLSALQQKDSDDKKKKKELESWWSESSVKKQIDLGTTLLTSLGNNSKKQHKIQQGLSVANAGMNTAEGVTKALAKQDYAGATFTALTGAAQIAAILSSTPDGGGGKSAAVGEPAATAPETVYNEQTTTVTDISAGQSSQQIFQLQFTDDVIDALATRIDKSKSDGRT